MAHCRRVMPCKRLKRSCTDLQQLLAEVVIITLLIAPLKCFSRCSGWKNEEERYPDDTDSTAPRREEFDDVDKRLAALKQFLKAAKSSMEST